MSNKNIAVVTGLDVINKDIDRSKIEKIEDLSDDRTKRARVYFTNGHWLSVIIGQYTYGGDQGLFEIMPSDETFFDEDDKGMDDVLGYLTPERVTYYINKIGGLPS